MKITNFTDELGTEMVTVDNGDGTFLTTTKAYWDELEAQREQSGTL